MLRGRAYVVTLALMALVLSPLLTGRDSFPHSEYPMFASARPRVSVLSVSYGLDAEGRLHRLSPSTIGGSIEVIHAAATVSRAIATGDADRLCSEIAGRVADEGPDEVVTVVVARETHDVVESMAGEPVPLERDVHAICEVVR